MSVRQEEFRIRGWHVLGGFTAAFGIIIAVNVYMATQAIETFPGLETENSYVASQVFDAERKAQEALGWTVETRMIPGGIEVRFPAEGGPVAVHGLFGRSTSATEDHELAFAEVAPGLWRAETPAGPGQWVLHLTAEAPDGTGYRSRVSVPVR